MKIDRLVDLIKLGKSVELGYITTHYHPTLPLTLYNYTQKTKHSRNWTDETKVCRGLITNNLTLDIVSRPWEKFFDLDSPKVEESKTEYLPSYEPEVTSLLDGHLGILWRFNDTVGVATRSGFDNPIAQWATEFFNRKYAAKPWPVNITIMFELLHKDYPVILNNNYHGLVLIGGVETETGRSISYEALKQISDTTLCPVVQKMSMTVDQCKEQRQSDHGGYVLTWNPGWNGETLKVRLKHNQYRMYSTLIENITEYEVWNILKYDHKVEALTPDGCPAKYRNWIWKTVDSLRKRYILTEDLANQVLKLAQESVGAEDKKRRSIADIINKYPPVSKIAFAMLDKKPYKDMIWSSIEPKDSQKFNPEM